MALASVGGFVPAEVPRAALVIIVVGGGFGVVPEMLGIPVYGTPVMISL